MSDICLQITFEGKIFNIGGIKRECYYCTYEDGGAWIWLRTNSTDNCRDINFIVRSSKSLNRLRQQVLNNEEISVEDYGYLSMQS